MIKLVKPHINYQLKKTQSHSIVHLNTNETNVKAQDHIRQLDKLSSGAGQEG